MGNPGVPFPYGEEDIRNAIITQRGVMNKVAKQLNCDPSTLYRHFNKYPALKPILDEYRWGQKEEDLDSAVDVLRYAMTECKEKDLTNSLKASFYFLNNRGQERGFTSLPEVTNHAVDRATEEIKALAETFRQGASPLPLANTEHKEDQS